MTDFDISGSSFRSDQYWQYKPLRDKSRASAMPIDPKVTVQIHYKEMATYLENHLAKEPANARASAREKLRRLTRQQFQELSTDVYDELLRRKDNTDNKEVPFLPVRGDFLPARNQARQKLATLPSTRFKDLSGDVFHELGRRYPEFREPETLQSHTQLEDTAVRLQAVLSPYPSLANGNPSPNSPSGSYMQSQSLFASPRPEVKSKTMATDFYLLSTYSPVLTAQGSSIIETQVDGRSIPIRSLEPEYRETKDANPDTIPKRDDSAEEEKTFSVGRLETTHAYSLARLLQKLSDSGLDLTDNIVQQGATAKKLGGHADIFLGICSFDNRRVAIKRLRFDLKSDLGLAKKLSREIRVWSKLHHSNVLPLRGFMSIGDSYPALITDWMENGTVIEYIRTNPLVDKSPLIEGIANGLHYLHREDVIHADLKCANILVTIDGIPLIMDFGISHLMHATSTIETATCSDKGTIRWMSPELLSYEDGEGEKVVHTKLSDVWAFGMTILELLTEKSPYSHLRTDAQVMLALYRGELPPIPAGFSDWKREEMQLLNMCRERCWRKNPLERPSMSRLLDTLREIRKACTDDG